MRNLPTLNCFSKTVFSDSVFTAMNRSFVKWSALVITACGLSVVIITFQSPRIPFDAVTWKKGYPFVVIHQDSGQLLSVNGISTRVMLDRAVRQWGVSYQDHFIETFPALTADGNTNGFISNVKIAGKKDTFLVRALNTWWRYRNCRSKTRATSFSVSGDLSFRDAEEDIVFFRRSLDDRFAYRSLIDDTTYKLLLDSLQMNLSMGIGRYDLAMRIERFLAYFDDPHSRVSFQSSGLRKVKVDRPWASTTMPVESHLYPGGIGCLRLRRKMFPGEKFKLEIIDAMNGMRDARGLIVDLRGNTGGSRDAIPLLLQYLNAPERFPIVVNVAAFRFDHPAQPAVALELLRGRHLWSVNHYRRSARTMQIISQTLRMFQPEMHLPGDKFSPLHFMIVAKSIDPSVYSFSRPVIVLHDSLTSSAAGVLLASLKGLPNVTLMGQRSSSDSGYPQAYRLPHSGLVYWLSSMACFKPDGTLLQMTDPDVAMDADTLVHPTRDLWLEHALVLLRDQSNTTSAIDAQGKR